MSFLTLCSPKRVAGLYPKIEQGKGRERERDRNVRAQSDQSD